MALCGASEKRAGLAAWSFYGIVTHKCFSRRRFFRVFLFFGPKAAQSREAAFLTPLSVEFPVSAAVEAALEFCAGESFCDRIARTFFCLAAPAIFPNAARSVS